jgi:hypothetical protein
MAMPESSFKVVAGAADWGSPLAAQPSFPTLEEAQQVAREYLNEQRKSGGPALPERISVEETKPDGTIVTHRIA